MSRPRRLLGSRRQQLVLGAAGLVALAVVIVGLANQTTTADLPTTKHHHSRSAPATVVVPKVVGDSPCTAMNKLNARHLGHKFSALGPSCAGLPAAGDIIEQRPRSGTKVSSKINVAIQTSCPQTVPTCKPYQVAIRTYGGSPEYTGSAGARLVNVGLRHIAGPPCELDSPITLELLESDGALAAVQGNPSSYALHRKTGLGEDVIVTWDLGGHTSPPRRFAVHAAFGATSTTGHVKSPRYNPNPAGLSVSRGGGYPPDISLGTGANDYRAALITSRAYGQ